MIDWQWPEILGAAIVLLAVLMETRPFWRLRS